MSASSSPAVDPASSNVALRMDQLSYQYPSGQTALRQVSLTVGKDEALGIIGPNGAGKTTLLLHLNGLLPGDTPQPVTASATPPVTGSTSAQSRPVVEVLGLEVIPKNFREIRRAVGFLFEDPDDQLFCATVFDDVAFGPLNWGLSDEEVVRRVQAALAQVNLSGFEDRGIHELSFGERRRAALAGVLACDPSVLALDEPTSNLDPRERRNLIRLLRDCRLCQIIASHDLEMILELCGRVLLLDQGTVCACGDTRTILSDEALLEAHGLEVPLSLKLGRHC